jgi:hypothetical protein
MKKQTNLNNKRDGKSELLKEVDRQFKKEVERIEKKLSATPDREKYIQSELNIIHNILHKEIFLKDLFKINFGVYYKTGRFDYPKEQIDKIRHYYRLYIEGIVPAENVLNSQAEDIISAILFYQLEGYLKSLNVKKAIYPDKKYDILDELFINPTDIETSIKALTLVDPPVIDEKGNFLKHKGMFVVWIDVLRRRGKLHKIDDKLLPELLEKKFPGLKISDSLFRQQNIRAGAFKTDLLQLIS